MNNTPNPTNQPGTSPKGVKTPKKRRKGGGSKLLNLFLIIGIIAVGSMLFFAEQERRSAQQQLHRAAEELDELRRSSEITGAEVSARVLERVSELIEISMDPEPTVATIVDVATLQEANEFYRVAKDGDHLIITSRRAILYDPDRNIILDVVPVIIDETMGEEDEGGIPPEQIIEDDEAVEELEPEFPAEEAPPE